MVLRTETAGGLETNKRSEQSENSLSVLLFDSSSMKAKNARVVLEIGGAGNTDNSTEKVCHKYET